MKRELIVQNDPKAPISEIFRTLRTNIQFMNTKNKLQAILITSTLPGEGKSWVSSNLAVTFAQAGKNVILIDADMRKGRQYSIFDVSPKPGLSNYLSQYTEGEEKLDLIDYIQETKIEGLYVISAGNIPPNPSELLASENMLNLMDKLKEICDIVIVDGPPTGLVTDPLIMARIVDSTVIVTASNQTKKEDLHRVVNNIQKIGGKIAGIVINKVSMSSKKYGSRYYYGVTDASKVQKMGMPQNYKNTPRRKLNLEKMNNVTVQEQASVSKITEDVIQEKHVEENKGKKLNRLEIESKKEATGKIGRVNDILRQMNKYLDSEKEI